MCDFIGKEILIENAVRRRADLNLPSGLPFYGSVMTYEFPNRPIANEIACMRMPENVENTAEGSA